LNGAVVDKFKPILNLIAYLDDISKEAASLKSTESIHADYANLTLFNSQLQEQMITLDQLTLNFEFEQLKDFD
jgi:hypothetical protein